VDIYGKHSCHEGNLTMVVCDLRICDHS